MIKKIVVGMFAYFVWCVSAWAQPISVVDDTGAEVSFAKPVTRVVSLAPHVTEMLFAVGAGEQLVGAVEYSDYPEAAKKVTRVGSYNQFDLEAIAVLQPDLIVAWHNGNPQAAVERLQVFDIPIYYSEPKSFEDVASNMERLAKLTGHDGVGAEAAGKFRQQLADLQHRYQSPSKVSVFYQIWNKPLMTINGTQLISKVIALCGGVNIFADLSITAPQVDKEAVLLANPQAIIASGMVAQRPDWLDEWKQWPHLSAVQTGSIYTIDPDLIQRHSPRILQGAELMCQHLDDVRSKLTH